MTTKCRSKNFALYDSPDERHVFVCFSLDSTRPENYLEQLESELQKRSRPGLVLLDLFASNGASSRRFFEVSFDGKTLQWLNARIAKSDDINSATLDYCRRFYSKRKTDMQRRGILSKPSLYREFKDLKTA